MGVRPNFQDPVEIMGADMIVAGTSDGDPLPLVIQVFLEQHDAGAGPSVVAGGSVDKPSAGWRATLASAGFRAGQALAFGVEIRTQPFEATTWSQVVEIR